MNFLLTKICESYNNTPPAYFSGKPFWNKIKSPPLKSQYIIIIIVIIIIIIIIYSLRIFHISIR